MTKKLIFAALGLALLTLAGFTLARNKSEINEAATYREPIGKVPVQVLTVRPTLHAPAFRYSGLLEPAREVSFGAELQGKISQTFVQEGAYLPAGKAIAKLDDRMLQLQLQSQQNQKALAEVSLQTQQALAQKTETDMTRFDNLKQNDAVADISYQNQKLNHTQVQGGLEAQRLSLKGADLALQTTQTQLDKTVIKAPISGYLTRKQFEVGSIVAPGAPMGTITDISQLKLVVMVPEQQVVAFQLGQKVAVRAEVYPAAVWEGTLTQIAAKGDQNHNFKVEVMIENDNEAHPLKAGMYGSLELASAREVERILIPNTALLGSGEQLQVYVVQDGKARLQPVKTGTSVENNIEITTGLQAGDQLITTGMNRLRQGLTVNIVE